MVYLLVPRVLYHQTDVLFPCKFHTGDDVSRSGDIDRVADVIAKLAWLVGWGEGIA